MNTTLENIKTALLNDPTTQFWFIENKDENNELVAQARKELAEEDRSFVALAKSMTESEWLALCREKNAEKEAKDRAFVEAYISSRPSLATRILEGN